MFHFGHHGRGRFHRGERHPHDGLRGGRHGVRAGGIGRFFEHGDIRLVVLGMIAEKPRHGYEIIKDIEDRLNGAYAPSPGVVYPTLSMLEEQGLVSATVDGAKRLFTITPDGQAYLDANRATVDALFARMAATGGASEPGGASPSVLRAMHNVRLALRLRLARGNITPEAATAIAAALDAAATAVERT